MDWVDFSSKVVVGAVSGLTVAIYTAKYTLNKFYTEKWWEKKYESYSQLLSTLYSLKIIYETSLDDSWALESYYAEESGGRKPEPKADWSGYKNLIAELKKILVMSPLLLSDTTKPKIDNFFRAMQEVDREVEHSNYPDFLAYDDILSSLNELLNDVIIEAQHELNHKKSLRLSRKKIIEYSGSFLSKMR